MNLEDDVSIHEGVRSFRIDSTRKSWSLETVSLPMAHAA
jgi:hypothetical protein